MDTPPRIALEKLTPMTIVDRAQLRLTIRKVREDGYSLVDQEVELGFRSISVPLRRLDGRVIASLNIGAHSRRCTLNDAVGVFAEAIGTRANCTADDLMSGVNKFC